MNHGQFPISSPPAATVIDDKWKYPEFVDEFVGGLATTGNIGSLGWSLGAGTVTETSGLLFLNSSPHTGTIQLSSTTTSNTRGRIFLHGASNAAASNYENWYAAELLEFIFCINSSAFTSFSARVGVMDENQINTTGETVTGIYLSTLAADSNWFVRHNGTRINTGLARASEKWILLQIKRDLNSRPDGGSGRWSVFVNEQKVASGIRFSGAGLPFPAFVIETNNSTAKTIVIDYFRAKLNYDAYAKYLKKKRYDP